jgi:hypothetical protein
MSWPLPKVIDTLKPPVKLHYGRWLLFFIILLFITAITLAFIWPNNDYTKQWPFWVSIIFIPSMISGIAISIRFYLYGLAQEKYEIWQHEQKHITQNWQAWAMKSLVVIDSYYHLPNQITTQQILTDSSNLAIQLNKSLAFDEALKFNQHMEDLFFSIRHRLSTLPATQLINITVYSSNEAYDYIDDDINLAYRVAKIEQPYTLSHQMMPYANPEKLTEWIDSTETGLQLVIINNTISSGSAFLSAFLLMNKQQYLDLAIDIAQSEILRPMITDDIVIGMNQMVEMQTATREINQLWYANLDNKQEVNIQKQLAELNIYPEQVYTLESLAGNQTQLSYWLLLALGCEMITKTKQNNLITARKQNQWLFSVMTAVSKES